MAEDRIKFTETRTADLKARAIVARIALGFVALGGATANSSALGMTLQPTPSENILSWGSFSVTPALSHGRGTIKVEVAEVRESRDPSGSQDFWIAEKSETGRSGQMATLWVDSRTCDALLPAMSKLAGLGPIRITPPGTTAGVGPNIITDGATYEVVASGIYPAENAIGYVRLTGNIDAPIAGWVDNTLSAIKPCWSSTPPVRVPAD